MTGGELAHAATDQEQRLSPTSIFTCLDLQLSNTGTINYHQFAHPLEVTARHVKVYLDQSRLVLLRALVHQGMERCLDATVRCLSMISLDAEQFLALCQWPLTFLSVFSAGADTHTQFLRA